MSAPSKEQVDAILERVSQQLSEWMDCQFLVSALDANDDWLMIYRTESAELLHLSHVILGRGLTRLKEEIEEDLEEDGDDDDLH